jgi:hypothetical protein
LTTNRVHGTGHDTLASVENAGGSDRRNILDNLIGNSADDILADNFGNDHIEGRAGDDQLAGGFDTDFLDGGSGTDTCSDGETVLNCEDVTRWLVGQPGTSPGAAPRTTLGREFKRRLPRR